jgi:hypothetical protein
VGGHWSLAAWVALAAAGPGRSGSCQAARRQVGQDERQPGDVVAGVADDQDVRVAWAPVPGLGQAADDGAELAGGDGGGVVLGPRRTASSTAVQQVRPASSAATTEYGQPGISWGWFFARP